VAKERPTILSRGERGASLILVLVALATLMPLALILSDLVLMRQRQVNRHQQNVGGQVMVRGALELAMSRLESGRIALGSAQSAEFELEEAPRPVRVRVTRHPDAVLDAESPARYPFAAVRLLAVVGRLDEGVVCLGVRYDRGYFP
jgi:hypothetical protein